MPKCQIKVPRYPYPGLKFWFFIISRRDWGVCSTTNENKGNRPSARYLMVLYRVYAFVDEPSITFTVGVISNTDPDKKICIPLRIEFRVEILLFSSRTIFAIFARLRHSPKLSSWNSCDSSWLLNPVNGKSIRSIHTVYRMSRT